MHDETDTDGVDAEMHAWLQDEFGVSLSLQWSI